MKILFVCSFNKNRIPPFVLEQVISVKKYNISIEFFTIKGRGFIGYLKNYFSLLATINRYKPDIIHAHYGLSGLLANLQRKVPVVTTFHGSDVNSSKAHKYSWLASRFSAATIFVEPTMAKKLKDKRGNIIPCAVDTMLFREIVRKKAREILAYKHSDNIVLFSSAFTNKVKNYPLAKRACEIAQKDLSKKINLIELANYSRDDVNLLLNACNMALLTSFSEGSPQFVKEAMACNCPVVATDVGDVAWLFGNEPGYFLTGFDEHDVADKIKMALNFSEKTGKTHGRERIIKLGLDSDSTAKKIIKLYESLLEKKTIK